MGTHTDIDRDRHRTVGKHIDRDTDIDMGTHTNIDRDRDRHRTVRKRQHNSTQRRQVLLQTQTPQTHARLLKPEVTQG